MTTTQQMRRESPAVIDVGERDFETAVLARSRELPVVVDFWAPWCGPCRTLGPILERLARESNGGFVLAKVNVDENQRLARAFQVQGIPAVKAFHNGRVVAEFNGAQPEPQVRAWLRKLAPPQGDDLLAAAAELEARSPEEAIARYQLVLGSEPTNPEALFRLGRLLVLRGEQEGAAVLAEVPEGTPFYAQAQAVLELAAFFAEAAQADSGELERRAAASPADLEARYRLAALAARSGSHQAAFDHLLAIIQRNRGFHNDGARKAMVALFALLGDDAPLTVEYRRKLANALF